ncbi:unnamed protein product, partial [Didymodactylos carnosus]
ISAYLDPRTHASLTTEDKVHAKDLVIEQGKQTNLPSTNPDHSTQASSSTTTSKGDKDSKLYSFLKMTGMSTIFTGFGKSNSSALQSTTPQDKLEKFVKFPKVGRDSTSF